jgi:hypothetical protein
MVADAPDAGGLSPRAAGWLLAAVVAAAAVTATAGAWMSGSAAVPPPKPAEFLAERAREVLRKAGEVGPPPGGVAYGFGENHAYLYHAQHKPADSPRWRDRLRRQPPTVFEFWYRQSPFPLVPEGEIRVGPENPWPRFPGEVLLRLDAEGRLLEYRAVPPEDGGRGASGPFDWSAFDREAGFEPGALAAGQPWWTPPAYADARAARDGTYPGRPDLPLHVEAASFRGRPVYFEVAGPWGRPWRDRSGARGVALKGTWVLVGMCLSLLTFAAALAYRNVRLGRGDLTGARRLTAAFLALHLASWALLAWHTSSLPDELRMVLDELGYALVVSLILATFYLALEPYVRRIWPNVLISWARVLAGRWRDPKVGADLLVGSLFGLVVQIVVWCGVVAPAALGLSTHWPRLGDPDRFLGGPVIVAAGLGALVRGVTQAMVTLAGFLINRLIFRRFWPAVAVTVAWQSIIYIFTLYNYSFPTDPLFGLLVASVLAYVLFRHGFLALFVACAVGMATSQLPLDLRPSAPDPGGRAFAMVVALAPACFGFYTALGGRRLFRDEALDDGR